MKNTKAKCGATGLLLCKLRQENHLSRGGQGQPEPHGKTPSQKPKTSIEDAAQLSACLVSTKPQVQLPAL